MNNKIGTLRTMLLSFNAGGGMTEKQENWVLSWIHKNLEPYEIDKAATIAYQYDVSDDIVEKIRNLK